MSDHVPSMNGYASSVKRLLCDEGRCRERPGIVLQRAQAALQTLVADLERLRTDIDRYAQRATEAPTVRDVLFVQLDDYQHNVVERVYYRLKTAENVVRFRSDISERLDELAGDHEFIAAAGRELAATGSVSANETPELAFDLITELRSLLQSVDRLLAEIDERHAGSGRAACRRIRYWLYRDESGEADLADMIRGLNTADPCTFELWDNLIELFRVRTLDESSFYTEPRRDPERERLPVQPPGADRQRRQRLVAEAHENGSGAYSRQTTFEWAAHLLADRHQVPLDEIPLSGDDDLMQLICLHAYGHDPEAPYRIVCGTEDFEFIWRGPYGIRAGWLKRRDGHDRLAPRESRGAHWGAPLSPRLGRQGDAS